MCIPENSPVSGLVEPTVLQEMGNKKVVLETRQNRRALSVISENVVRGGVSKRGLLEKQAICEKRIHAPVQRRPVTRRFAAQLASRQHSNIVEPKKPELLSIWTPGESEDCEIEDVEEHKAAPDHPVPMLVEQTETKIDEMNQVEEVEMEDIDGEPIMDIDGPDARNPLAVAEYVEELYAYYRRTEISSCVSPDYMAQQFDINHKMRAILIDWLIEVHDKFELMEETLFLTVNLVDRFLAQQTVERKKLQLVGLVAMLLACKYEEVSVPVVADLIIISDKAYTRKEFLEMERLMLNTLQFNMSVPTPYVFMKRFLKAAQSDKKMELLSFFLMDVCLVEYEMLKFPPSLLAAASIYTAQCTLYGFKQWDKTCEHYTSYTEDQLLECSRLIVNLHQNAGSGKLTAAQRKYCTSKLGYTSKCEPAHFLLGTQQQQ